jgi:hypothetical protein
MLNQAGFMLISASLSLQGGYGFRNVLENIPTDPLSLFVYALLTVCVGWIVWGSRKKGTPSSGPKP